MIIDDFGAETDTDFALKTKFKVLDTLLNNFVPIIITSNYSISDWVQLKKYDFKGNVVTDGEIIAGTSGDLGSFTFNNTINQTISGLQPLSVTLLTNL